MFLDLKMMFLLIDKVPGAVSTILNHLEDFIYQAGLDDMKQCADSITSVCEIGMLLLRMFIRVLGLGEVRGRAAEAIQQIL